MPRKAPVEPSEYLPLGRSIQPIGSLRPHPQNPHVIDATQIAFLRASIMADPAFMIERPVLVSDGPINLANRLMYAGHQRVEALKGMYAAGYVSPLWPVGHVPIDCQDVDEKTVMERLLRDNNHWADWLEEKVAAQLRHMRDMGSSLTELGFVQEELDALLERDGVVSTLAGRNGDRGETLEERKEAYDTSDIRKIELHYLTSDFSQVAEWLDATRGYYGVESNAEAVLNLLREQRKAAALENA